MPDTTPFSIEIRSAAVWRSGVAALAVATALGIGMWVATLIERGAWVRLWLVLPAALAIAAAVSMRWTARTHLRWDGELWHLADAAPGTAPGAGRAQPGTMAVALDGGTWMLLRFRATDGADRPRVRWLAPSRRELGGAWHALRCAVYSPRPDPASPPAQACADPLA